MWVIDKESGKMVQQNCTYVPALYKIFDEILVNAADNKQRDANINRINIDTKTNTIRIWNNGKGIPIQIRNDEGIYVPELLFGHY